MLVSEIIEGFRKKEITGAKLAKMYDKSTKTISNKIKGLGYEWDSVKGFYIHTGEKPEQPNVDFGTLFEKKPNQTSGSNKSKTNSKSKTTSKNASIKEIASTKESSNEIDELDKLLFGDEQTKRVYRGFYLDDDIVKIIDNVKSGNKSDVINEALRMVFKQKGLL